MGKKLLMALLVLALIATCIWWVRALYFFTTVPGPAHGGQYVEGIIDQPRFINPLLAASSSPTDKTITPLVFSSLFSYDRDGLLQPDLAESFDRSEDGTVYTVHLRQGVLWHDGVQLTADDVVFTAAIAKNIDYGAAGVSSDIRLAWTGVDVAKVDDHIVTFTLEKPRTDFLHTLTLGILPAHAWTDVSAEQFNLSDLNSKPIGTGPYEFVDVTVDGENNVTEYILRANEDYYKGEPYVTKLVFRVYLDRATIVDAYNSGNVGGLVVDTPELLAQLRMSGSTQRIIGLPSYFAVFFNQTKSVPLAYDEVREALTLATDRDAIVDTLFGDLAQPVHSPILPGMRGYDADAQQPGRDVEAAKKKLDEKEWAVGEDGIRSKGDDRLSFTLQVNAGHEQLLRAAEMLRDQWREIGAEVHIENVESDKLLRANVIKPRAYEALFASQPTRWDQPQLLPLWHSDERADPGSNYALMQDDAMDEALNALQTETDFERRAALYKTVQERILVEDPAVFLFAPDFAFVHTDTLRGDDVTKVNVPYDRFADVENWYVKEKRSLR